MKIAFLTTANSWHVPVKVKYFVNNNYEVFYFHIHPGTEQKIRPEGCKNIDIIPTSNNKIIARLSIINQVKKYIKEYGIDLIHIIDMGYAYLAPFLKNCKIVLENNGSDVLVAPKKNKKLKYLYKLFYKFADAVVQDSIQSQQAGISLGAPTTYNEIIELGIDFSYFNENVPKGIARKRMGLEEHVPIVFSPRGFTELYNIDIILKTIPIVAKCFPDVKYVFCRHFGKVDDIFQKVIDELKLKDYVIYTGYLDNTKDMPFYYKDSNVVVSVPSSDSSPRSVYEAMACKVPVIISDLDWYKSKFKKDEDVAVVPVRDVQALANEIIEIISNKYLNLNNAYNIVFEKINAEKHNKKLEELYKLIIKTN